MVMSNQLAPGMVVTIGNKFYKVESCVKVSVPKRAPFMKARFQEMKSGKILEKNFKPEQTVQEVSLTERTLEFLYMEGKDFLFLDTDNLEQVLVPSEIISEKVNFLKENIQVKGFFYGDQVFSIELPQFLEIMISHMEGDSETASMTNIPKTAILETGAKIEVPPFIESGDVIKVDTKTGEYIQRV